MSRLDDAPDHTAYRALTADDFKGQNLMRVRDQTRAITRTFVDKMAAHNGRCDFASNVAFLYPLCVIRMILGLPEKDELRMVTLTRQLFGSDDEAYQREGMAPKEVVEMVINDFIAFLTEVTHDRRANPRDDLASVIANGQIDPTRRPPEFVQSYFVSGLKRLPVSYRMACWHREDPSWMLRLTGLRHAMRIHPSVGLFFGSFQGAGPGARVRP